MKYKYHIIREMIKCDIIPGNILDNVKGAPTLSASLATLIVLVEDIQISYYYPKACRDCFTCSQSRETLIAYGSQKYVDSGTKRETNAILTHK